MSQMNFFKYQGTGNDFIILDNRNWSYTALTTDRVRFLCDRRFGIGADGLMLGPVRVVRFGSRAQLGQTKPLRRPIPPTNSATGDNCVYRP